MRENIQRIFTFAEALASAHDRKSILIGNGFSQAWRREIFSYGSLFDRADFSGLSPQVRPAFQALRTTNFEFVIKVLRDASKMTELYAAQNPDLAALMRADSEGLKAILVRTIAENHPASPGVLSDDEFQLCRAFLRHFGSIYTLNYDLLLYWSLMHEEDGEEEINCDDGFRHPDGEEDVDYVSWEIENTNEQNIHYLHGALHIFESEVELRKYTWSRTGVSLMNQISDALNNDLFPVIVAEGTSEQKMSRIMKSAYLQRGLKSLSSKTGALFIFGMALHANDEHILKRLRKGKISELWVGIFGDPNSEENRALQRRAIELATNRPPRRPLAVSFYDTSTVRLWR